MMSFAVRPLLRLLQLDTGHCNALLSGELTIKQMNDISTQWIRLDSLTGFSQIEHFAPGPRSIGSHTNSAGDKTSN